MLIAKTTKIEILIKLNEIIIKHKGKPCFNLNKYQFLNKVLIVIFGFVLKVNKNATSNK